VVKVRTCVGTDRRETENDMTTKLFLPRWATKFSKSGPRCRAFEAQMLRY